MLTSSHAETFQQLVQNQIEATSVFSLSATIEDLAQAGIPELSYFVKDGVKYRVVKKFRWH